MKAIIYKITNDINSKVYVGQTWKTAEQRFKRHCAEARWKHTKRMPIVLAMVKYGESHFKIEVVEEYENCSQEYLNEKEVFWVKELNTLSPNGYNLRAGGGSNGILISEETKKKIAASNTGRKASAETIEKLRISHLGYKVKESTKRKLSEINKGKKLSAEHIRKIAASNTGKKLSEEAKEKMRQKKLKFSYEVKSPDGRVLETNNLTQFCREYNLNGGHMGSVACGNKKDYKGWTVVKVRNELRGN